MNFHFRIRGGAWRCPAGKLLQLITLDLRKSAFFALVAGTFGGIAPVRRFYDSAIPFAQSGPGLGWGLLAILIGVLYVAPFVMFFFALSLNQSPLRISPRLRSLSRASAATIALLQIPGVGGMISRGSSVPEVLSLISGISIVVLMTAFSNHSEQLEPGEPPSKFLHVSTIAALASGGAALLFALWMLFGRPVFYFMYAQQAMDAGHPLPPLLQMMMDPLEEVLTAATAFLAPWIVFRSLRAK